jgi:hypothetical protein
MTYQSIREPRAKIVPWLAAVLFVMLGAEASALPLYTAREGRTCDNCHTLPNNWADPEAAKDKKCSLSCSSCHVDPAGGGLRNTAGKFYGQSVLPMGLSRYRNYKDTARNLLNRFDEANKETHNPPTLSFGEPVGKSTKYAPEAGRYGEMNADPLLSLGLDSRLAMWSIGPEATLFFPMQFDTQAALHPVHHVKLYVNAGFLAKEKGVAAALEENPPFAAKDAMLIINELPYQSYVKVGRFTPDFGLRLDDHTSFTRRDFEQDYGVQSSRVIGAEFGMSPNYPYLSASVFRPSAKDDLAFDPDPSLEEPSDFLGAPRSFGGALSAGYRELGWQVGASAIAKRRESTFGGNTNSVSLQWGFNPWFYSDRLPFTYTGEIVAGTFERSGNSSQAIQAASTQILDYSPWNGINLQLKYDYTDPDFEVINDHINRIGGNLDITFVPGVRLTLMTRATFVPLAEVPTVDILAFLRLWVF